MSTRDTWTLILQNVAFRHCLFGRAPSCFTSANQTNRAVAYCLQFSSPHCRAYFLPLLLCGVPAKPDWTETCTLQEFEPPPCRVAWLKTLVSVCFSFCCCSVCLRFWQQNCHLLCCTCLCLWESCYSISGFCATVSECVCVWVCVCVFGCGCRVLANLAPTWTSYFPVLLQFILCFL